jgi:hypothetical protein
MLLSLHLRPKQAYFIRNFLFKHPHCVLNIFDYVCHHKQYYFDPRSVLLSYGDRPGST